MKRRAAQALVWYVHFIWILIVVDFMAYKTASPVQEKRWRYYIPVVGGWMALHDKINALERSK